MPSLSGLQLMCTFVLLYVIVKYMLFAVLAVYCLLCIVQRLSVTMSRLVHFYNASHAVCYGFT